MTEQDPTPPTPLDGEGAASSPAPASAETTEPDVPKTGKKRSAKLIFTQAVLMLEAFCALFATLLLWGLARGGMVDVPIPWLLGGGLVLVLIMAWASGKQAKSWGQPLGWALQVPLIVAGLLDPAIAVVGVVFLILWIMGLRIGGRIDRERAEFDAAQEARESPE
ncbi:DUF4233 domain-containing protein [Demequina flava]|uniref:DUF4233 domain-containing protein n=1 Tax=Demequina flava TaxID=1095025 RepID=UPI000780BDA2|nr:DUF4233 domain-containing protein [Demequina flava]